MPYKPKRGTGYYMINSRFQVKMTENTGSQKSIDRIAAGNAFNTEADAKKFRDHVLQLAQHGYYKTGTVKVGWIAKILTWLVYLLLIVLVVVVICLLVDFIFWIFDIKVTLPGWLKR